MGDYDGVTFGPNFVSVEPRVAAEKAADTTRRIKELWDKTAEQVEGYTSEMAQRDYMDAWIAAEAARVRAVMAEEKRCAEVRQLARDLLLTLVRRGEQQINPAAVWQVAREFVAAGE